MDVSRIVLALMTTFLMWPAFAAKYKCSSVAAGSAETAISHFGRPVLNSDVYGQSPAKSGFAGLRDEQSIKSAPAEGIMSSDEAFKQHALSIDMKARAEAKKLRDLRRKRDDTLAVKMERSGALDPTLDVKISQKVLRFFEHLRAGDDRKAIREIYPIFERTHGAFFDYQIAAHWIQKLHKDLKEQSVVHRLWTRQQIKQHEADAMEALKVVGENYPEYKVFSELIRTAEKEGLKFDLHAAIHNANVGVVLEAMQSPSVTLTPEQIMDQNFRRVVKAVRSRLGSYDEHRTLPGLGIPLGVDVGPEHIQALYRTQVYCRIYMLDRMIRVERNNNWKILGLKLLGVPLLESAIDRMFPSHIALNIKRSIMIVSSQAILAQHLPKVIDVLTSGSTPREILDIVRSRNAGGFETNSDRPNDQFLEVLAAVSHGTKMWEDIKQVARQLAGVTPEQNKALYEKLLKEESEKLKKRGWFSKSNEKNLGDEAAALTKTEATEVTETPTQTNPGEVDWNSGIPVYRFFYERMVRAEIQILKTGEISLFDKANKLDWIAYLGFTGTVATGSTVWWQKENIGQFLSDFGTPIWVWTADKFHHLPAQPEMLNQILPLVGGG